LTLSFFSNSMALPKNQCSMKKADWRGHEIL
jgi:hypothetical protein